VRQAHRIAETRVALKRKLSTAIVGFGIISATAETQASPLACANTNPANPLAFGIVIDINYAIGSVKFTQRNSLDGSEWTIVSRARISTTNVFWTQHERAERGIPNAWNCTYNFDRISGALSYNCDNGYRTITHTRTCVSAQPRY